MSKTDYKEAADLNALTGLKAVLLTSAITTAQLEGLTSANLSTYKASYTGNGGGTYADQAVTLGTLTGSGDDSSSPSTRANTNVLTFPAWGAGVTPTFAVGALTIVEK